jgi:GNAT superfamily N-acetyltransferase
VGLDPVALRDVYDAQLRVFMPANLPEGMTLDTDGPLVRVTEPDSGFVVYRSLAGVDDVDGLIARTRDHFASLGVPVEWKLHGHDEPADLPARLVAAGFEPDEEETVVIGLAEPLADPEPPLPDGVRLREVTARADLDPIDTLKAAVWGPGRSGQAASLEAEIAADPSAITVVVASPESGPLASAAWVRFVPGTEFATLWGGATLPEWRGRGIYRALVAYRAALATSRGYAYLQVDASPMSRPILERLGFVAVTTTTPYLFTP